MISQRLRVNIVLSFRIAMVLLLVSAVVWLVRMEQAFRGPTPYDQHGLRRLQDIAEAAGPITAALRRYRIAHGSYPLTLSGLTLPDHPSDNWYYTGWKDGYTLYYKISWDPGLRFEYPTPAEWEYDPGNGNPEISLFGGDIAKSHR